MDKLKKDWNEVKKMVQLFIEMIQDETIPFEYREKYIDKAEKISEEE